MGEGQAVEIAAVPQTGDGAISGVAVRLRCIRHGESAVKPRQYLADRLFITARTTATRV
jgi:hypothetical protein